MRVFGSKRLAGLALAALVAGAPLAAPAFAQEAPAPAAAEAATAPEAATPAPPEAAAPAEATPAAEAAPAPTPDKGDVSWMLVSTILVLLMIVPGLALFYGGLVRQKNMLSMLMQVSTVTVVGMMAWLLWGYSLAFSDGGGVDSFVGGGGRLLLKDVTPASNVGTFSTGVVIPELAFVAFQMTFACITAALVLGGVAERMKFAAVLVFAVLWPLLSYYPMAHMVWWWAGPDAVAAAPEDPIQSGLIWSFGALDFAGGTVVHINAGVAGLVLVLLIGRRLGFGKEPMKPHNLTLTMIGAGLLWFGWFGFNVGSIVFVEGDGGEKDIAQFMSETGVTWINTTIATSAAMLAWLLVEKIRDGKGTSLGAASGIVAGLVAITPACGAVDVYGAIAIGAAAGALCALAVGLKYRFGYDDSLDVVGVHLVGGIVGTVMIGFVSSGSAPGGIDGLLYGGGAEPLVVQVLTALVAIAWSAVATLAVGLLIKATLGWRITDEDEAEGIDFVEHGESAYDLGTGGGARRSSVLQGSTASEGARA